MVRKENEVRHTDHDEVLKTHEGHGDVEVEGDMIIGEMDPDIVEHHPTPPSKHKHNQGTVRDDADEIVNGTHSTYDASFRQPSYNSQIPCISLAHGPSREPALPEILLDNILFLQRVRKNS